ncbi:uncharacterized protein IUM83_14675 [Phytophthora cinnamomi]|uniref:uncharacterized protein n=1 Tax=Phytophthora cinnamomi TaxID=4785 RepID=UPI00355A0C18|nr:hypothetical protein IUM83_14675 [Phytophthora cinnamomi]
MIGVKVKSWTKVVKIKLCLVDLVEVEAVAAAVVVAVFLVVVEVAAVVDVANSEGLVVVVEEVVQELDEDVVDKVPVEETVFIVESKLTKYVTVHTWADAHQVVHWDSSLPKGKKK